MSFSIADSPSPYTPTLQSSYSAGDILFTPVSVYNMTKGSGRLALIQQIGIFWDVADAPEITLFFFSEEPETWGDVGEQPAPSFDDRAKLIGEWDVDGSMDQGYGTLLGDNSLSNSYSLVSGNLLSVFRLPLDERHGYLTATIKTATNVDLRDKLKLTFILEANP